MVHTSDGEERCIFIASGRVAHVAAVISVVRRRNVSDGERRDGVGLVRDADPFGGVDGAAVFAPAELEGARASLAHHAVHDDRLAHRQVARKAKLVDLRDSCEISRDAVPEAVT